jgi:hypothetical protein
MPVGSRFDAGERRECPRSFCAADLCEALALLSFRFARDSPLEGAGFEPSVPLGGRTQI